MTFKTVFLLAIAAALALPHVAIADDDSNTSPFSLTFSAGAEYDSNVAVLELDTSSGESDVAALIDFGVGFDKKLKERLKVGLGYDFSQSLHDEFDQFDIQIHRGSAGVEYDFGSVDSGLTLQYADASLDSDEYLVLKQVSPHLSKLFGERLFLRFAWARTEKEFTTSPGRDATADSPSIDAFVFLNGVKSYLAFGYQYDDEDARDPQFDHTGSKLKAQLSRRFMRGAREITLKTGLRYESRAYREVLFPIGQRREDDRYRLEAELEASLLERGFLRARYEYADNRSNLASVDFDEHRASIGLGVKL